MLSTSIFLQRSSKLFKLFASHKSIETIDVTEVFQNLHNVAIRFNKRKKKANCSLPLSIVNYSQAY